MQSTTAYRVITTPIAGTDGKLEEKKEEQTMTTTQFIEKQIANLCEMIRRSGAAKTTDKTEQTLKEMGNFATAVALTVQFKDRFERDNEECIKNYIETYGWEISDFTDEEWRNISKLTSAIMKYIIKYILPTINF
jgi:hypothetical protein